MLSSDYNTSLLSNASCENCCRREGAPPWEDLKRARCNRAVVRERVAFSASQKTQCCYTKTIRERLRSNQFHVRNDRNAILFFLAKLHCPTVFEYLYPARQHSFADKEALDGASAVAGQSQVIRLLAALRTFWTWRSRGFPRGATAGFPEQAIPCGLEIHLSGHRCPRRKRTSDRQYFAGTRPAFFIKC